MGEGGGTSNASRPSSRRFWLRATMETWAPSFASMTAKARPVPLEPPVMKQCCRRSVGELGAVRDIGSANLATGVPLLGEEEHARQDRGCDEECEGDGDDGGEVGLDHAQLLLLTVTAVVSRQASIAEEAYIGRRQWLCLPQALI